MVYFNRSSCYFIKFHLFTDIQFPNKSSFMSAKIIKFTICSCSLLKYSTEKGILSFTLHRTVAKIKQSEYNLKIRIICFIALSCSPCWMLEADLSKCPECCLEISPNKHFLNQVDMGIINWYSSKVPKHCLLCWCSFDFESSHDLRELGTVFVPSHLK